MITIFDVPCPECGRSLTVTDRDSLECPACRRTYRSRMGHLFPVAERPASTAPSTIAVPATLPAVPARP